MSDEQTPLLHCVIPDARRQRLLLVDADADVGAELPTLERLKDISGKYSS